MESLRSQLNGRIERYCFLEVMTDDKHIECLRIFGATACEIEEVEDEDIRLSDFPSKRRKMRELMLNSFERKKTTGLN